MVGPNNSWMLRDTEKPQTIVRCVRHTLKAVDSSDATPAEECSWKILLP